MRCSLVITLAGGMIIAMCIGWSSTARTEKQRGAIQAIRQAGGRYYYDCQVNAAGVWGASDSRVPGFLKRMLRGVLGQDWRDWFYNVGYVALEGDLAGDDTLARVSTLEYVQLLALWSNTTVTERGWSDVGRMESLTWLSLQHSSLDDAGMRHLTRLRKLRKLELNNTLISDDSLEHLRSFPDMDELWISDTRISKAEGHRFAARLSDAVVDY